MPSDKHFGSAFADDGALPPGDIAGGRECLSSLILVAATEHQGTFAPQAPDFRWVLKFGP